MFLDLEATGLASAHPRTRITELSLVALSQQELWKYHRHLSEFRSDQVRHGASQDLESVTPRVLNKLTLCFYPGTMVPPQVSHLTGLDNYNLEDQKRFSGQSAAVVRDFLALLQKPICLIAHNGDRYKTHFQRANVWHNG